MNPTTNIDVSMLAQPGILEPNGEAGLCLEWDLVGDARSAVERLIAIGPLGGTVGFGKPFLDALSIQVPGLKSFEEARCEGVFPSTQHSLWAFFTGTSPSLLFDLSQRLDSAVAPDLRLVEVTPLYTYRLGRDLSGYEDGAGNPPLQSWAREVLLNSGDAIGGAFASVQRFVHRRRQFEALTADEKDKVIGRTLIGNFELDDAPESAHVKRTNQEREGTNTPIVRRSMAWGHSLQSGLQFIAFTNDLTRIEQMLARMSGAGDGVRDALLSYTSAQTGAFYFCPAAPGGYLSIGSWIKNPRLQDPEDKAMNKIEVVTAGTVQVRFDGSRCIHSRNCVLSRPDVFVPNVEGEWIHPERADEGALRELAHQCPSGAISVTRIDGQKPEAAPMVNLVRVRENGPLAVHADLHIDGKSQGFRATLCRCGASRNKPYCDSSHNTIGFKASGEATAVTDEPLEQRNGPVKVELIENGPLSIKGSVEIVSGTGHTIRRCSQTALCRCGHSFNKPFCDGTHQKIQFSAPKEA